MKRRLSAALAAGLLVAGLLVACGEATPTSPVPDTSISLVEYAIAIDGDFNDGPTVVRVFNIGHAHHNLSVCPTNDGLSCAGKPISHKMLQRPVDARDQSFFDDVSDSLTIGKEWETFIEFDLEPGSYRFFCGIIGHAARGMAVKVDVI